MEEMNQEKKVQAKSRLQKGRFPAKKIIPIVGVAIVLLVAVLWKPLFGTGKDDTTVDGDYMTIETAHGKVQIDAAYADVLHYEQDSKNDVAVEVYSMQVEGDGWELFRICLGDEKSGDLLGYLKDGETAIPVTVAVTSYEEADFPSAELRELYLKMMEQINAILAPLYSNRNFTSDPAQSVQVQKAKLTYWTLELPDSIRWEEKPSGDLYQVDFYGTIDEKEYSLYSVLLGDGEAESVVGAYKVDGVDKLLGVKTYDASQQMAQMSSEAASTYGTMMETINDVLQVIMADPNYSKKIDR